MMAEKEKSAWSEDELAGLSVRCLAVRLRGMDLLLPNTLVAEVTEISTVEAVSNSPEWLTGFVSWRGRNVPLISFEQLMGLDSPGRHDGNRIVVLNTLKGNPQIPFIAMEIQDLPRLSPVKNDMLEYDENDKQVKPVVLCKLRLEGESVLVPNIDVIEKMLENLNISK
jgi:chemosensory pili system protein ChpC